MAYLFQLDDIELQKFADKEKVSKLLSSVNGKIIRTASTDNSKLIELFAKMLETLNFKHNEELKSVMEKLEKTDKEEDSLTKLAVNYHTLNGSGLLKNLNN